LLPKNIGIPFRWRFVLSFPDNADATELSYTPTCLSVGVVSNNFVFYNEGGNTIKLQDKPGLYQAQNLKITWRIQENHQKGQTITLPLSAKEVCHQVCPVCAAVRMVL
jgi:hypothetical protein